jgi:hypothetical protein
LMGGIFCNDKSESRKGKKKAFGMNQQSYNTFLVCNLATLIAALFFWGAPIAEAANMTLTPRLAVGGSYDDNILLSTDDKVSSPIVTVSPSVELGYQTMLSNLGLKANWDFLSYLDESDLNRTNQYYRLSGDRRLTERWSTSGNVNFYRDTALNTYLQETGRVIGRIQRDYFEAGASVAHDFTQLSNISVGYRYRTASYDDARFNDYDNHNASLYYGHRLKNERDTLSIGPTYYHRTTDSNDVDSYTFDFGWARDWTSITRSSATIGVRHLNVKQKRDGSEYDTVGAKASVNITSLGLASRITFRYFHDLRTTEDGDDVNVDNFYLEYRRSITERFGTGINGRLVFSYKLFSEQSGLNDERYYWIEPNLFYRLTRDIEVSLRYRYQNHVEYFNMGSQTRERNIVWLQLSYAFPITL